MVRACYADQYKQFCDVIRKVVKMRKLADRKNTPLCWLVISAVLFVGCARTFPAREVGREKQDFNCKTTGQVKQGKVNANKGEEAAPGPIIWMSGLQIDPNREDMRILTGQKGEPNTLSGKVVDEKGNPLKGVLVDVWTWHKDNEAYTDANGYFLLVGFEPEQKTVEIRFSREGFTPKYLIRQPLGVKNTIVVLDDKTYFEGTVIAPDGKPVSDAAIRAAAGPKDCEGVVVGEVVTECKSDKNGCYRLYVQADVYDIQVKTDQGVARLPNIKIDKNEVKKLDIKLGNSFTFFAKVIDSQTQKPVKGIKLSGQQGIKGVSDSNGLIRIPNMLPGKFEFWVGSEDYCRWWSDDCISEWNRFEIGEKTGWQRNFDFLDFDIKNQTEPVVIVVEKGVKIKGRVLDPAGNPVAGATATLALTGSGNSITGDTRYSFETDANGNFEMMVPASKKARYNLVVHDGKYDQWRNWANGVLEPIQTNPGDVIENITINLTQPAVVKGTVVDNDGNPMPNHQVRAYSFDKLENRYYDPTARTDANGIFEIKFIRPGKHYIQAYPFWLDAELAPGGTSRIVTVKAQETVSGIKIVAQ
jgi:protocatechuate 3,4-dioxygenase beta subunit